jgi:hypothetical protein
LREARKSIQRKKGALSFFFYRLLSPRTETKEEKEALGTSTGNLVEMLWETSRK